jgi:hypothetical protein
MRHKPLSSLRSIPASNGGWLDRQRKAKIFDDIGGNLPLKSGL